METTATSLRRISELLELARAGRYLQIIGAGSNFTQPLNLFAVLQKLKVTNNKVDVTINIFI